MKPISFIGLVPIVVSSNAITFIPDYQTFKYNDVSENTLNIKNPETLSHLTTTQESQYFSILLRINFYKHFNKWQTHTRYFSSPNQIIQDEDFQEIIKLGRPAIPVIAQEIQRHPTYLVWALNLIFGFKISDSTQITIPEACKLWIKYLNAN